MDCSNNVEKNVLSKIEQILKENDNKLPYIGDIINYPYLKGGVC